MYSLAIKIPVAVLKHFGRIMDGEVDDALLLASFTSITLSRAFMSVFDTSRVLDKGDDEWRSDFSSAYVDPPAASIKGSRVK